jgi:hypothetical protein
VGERGCIGLCAGTYARAKAETVSGAARQGPPDPSVSQHFGLDWSQPRTDVNLEIYTVQSKI